MPNFLLTVLITASLFSLCSSQSFCDGICLKTGCNGNTQNNCNGKCMNNWVVSGSTCTINTALQWRIVDTTGDLGGAITSNAPALSTTVCSPFSLYGALVPANTITFNVAAYNTPYFQLTAYVWVILFDYRSDWNSNSIMTLTFVQAAVATINKVSYYVARTDYCKTNAREVLIRYAVTYNYNTTGAPFTWTLNTN